jgi:hypothetical protein
MNFLVPIHHLRSILISAEKFVSSVCRKRRYKVRISTLCHVTLKISFAFFCFFCEHILTLNGQPHWSSNNPCQYQFSARSKGTYKVLHIFICIKYCNKRWIIGHAWIFRICNCHNDGVSKVFPGRSSDSVGSNKKETSHGTELVR